MFGISQKCWIRYHYALCPSIDLTSPSFARVQTCWAKLIDRCRRYESSINTQLNFIFWQHNYTNFFQNLLTNDIFTIIIILSQKANKSLLFFFEWPKWRQFIHSSKDNEWVSEREMVPTYQKQSLASLATLCIAWSIEDYSRR